MMLSKSLTKALDLGAWHLDLAAWIFTGYSPLELKKTGHIIRLVDDLEIPHGSGEFRSAEEAQNEFLMSLNAMMIESVGFELTASDDEEFVNVWLPTNLFDRNWLINNIVNAYDPNERRKLWWLDIAIELHFVPAYINPSALSPRHLEDRGYTSYCYPHDVPKIDAENNSEDQPKVLYQPSGVKPHPSNYFYMWLYDKIKSMAHEVPDEQFEGHDPIEGWDKHCMPRPTGSAVRDIALSEEVKDKFRTTTTNDGALKYTNHIGIGEADEPILLPGVESKKIKRKSLGNRAAEWFELTEAGHQYQAYIKSKNS